MNVFSKAPEIVQYEAKVWEKRIEPDKPIILDYTRFNIPNKIVRYYQYTSKTFHRNKKNYIIFKDEWRKPLTIFEWFLFKIFSSLPMSKRVAHLEHYVPLTRFGHKARYGKVLSGLVEKGYVSIDIKKHRVLHKAKVTMKCFDPKGNIINKRNFSYKKAMIKKKYKERGDNKE